MSILDSKAEDQLLYSIYLCLNRVGPIHEGLELGLGESLLLKAVASASGKSLATVKMEVGKLGDLGKVVQVLRFLSVHLQTYFSVLC